MKQIKPKFALLAILVLVPTLLISGTKQASAFGMVYYGGNILRTTACTCPSDLGTVLTIYDYVSKMPIHLKYHLGTSLLRPNYNIMTKDVNVVGAATTGGSCMVLSVISGCAPNMSATPISGTIDFIIGIGTSLK